MSDLDARVAALMEEADKYADVCEADSAMSIRVNARIALRQAIRAELQKPALHEPVTSVEIDRAVSIIHGPLAIYNVEKLEAVQHALQDLLQGRAKPAQEEITDAERYVMFKSAILGGVYSQLWNTLAHKAKDARLTGHEIDEIINAAIRASKGEKT